MCGKDEFDIIGSLEIANTHRDFPTVQIQTRKKQLITAKTSTDDILVIYMFLQKENVIMGKFLLRISS